MNITGQAIFGEGVSVDAIATELARGAADHIRAGYLLGRVEGDKIVIEGVYVPLQESDAVMTRISVLSKTAALHDIWQSGRKVVGLVQYNAKFPAHQSAATAETHQELLRLGIPDLGLVVNAKGETKTFGQYRLGNTGL